MLKSKISHFFPRYSQIWTLPVSIKCSFWFMIFITNNIIRFSLHEQSMCKSTFSIFFLSSLQRLAWFEFWKIVSKEVYHLWQNKINLTRCSCYDLIFAKYTPAWKYKIQVINKIISLKYTNLIYKRILK